jgi:hypothetical protein
VSFLAAVPALAQEAGGFSAGQGLGAPPDYQTVVSTYRPSPPATQDRVFTTSRFWRLDPGRYEVEVWLDTLFLRDGAGAEATLQAEIEFGLTPHIQLDIYENFSFGTGLPFNYVGTSVEVRYSIASYYNAISWNPVLYLEFQTRKQLQDRLEFRLLIGGDLPWGGLWASNFYAESNIDFFRASYALGADAEVGVTASVSFPVVRDVLRLGAELQGGVDQHGTPTFSAVGLLGPDLLLTYRPARLKLTASALFGLFPQDPLVRLFLIAGWQW